MKVLPFDGSFSICRSAEASEPLSIVYPIPRNKLTPYRAVIIMRLIILGLFFHYRITNPVDSAFGLWLTSVICEIWFAFSWVLDQFPKWNPVNREAFIDRLSARYSVWDSKFLMLVKPLKLRIMIWCKLTMIWIFTMLHYNHYHLHNSPFPFLVEDLTLNLAYKH